MGILFAFYQFNSIEKSKKEERHQQGYKNNSTISPNNVHNPINHIHDRSDELLHRNVLFSG